jgi:hypothetical protein
VGQTVSGPRREGRPSRSHEISWSATALRDCCLGRGVETALRPDGPKSLTIARRRGRSAGCSACASRRAASAKSSTGTRIDPVAQLSLSRTFIWVLAISVSSWDYVSL